MKNNIFLYGFWITIILVSISACKRVIDIPIDINEGKNYYPVVKGKFIEYRVDSIIYDDFANTTISKTSYIKDEIDSSFKDLEGRANNYVIRSEKLTLDSPYIFKYAYYVNQNNNTYEVVDNNLRFVKLVFPISLKNNWEGNKYIFSPVSSNPNYWLNNWLYKYTEYDVPLILDSLRFDKTLTVLQEDESSNNGDTSASNPVLTDYIYSREQYARNVGLVQKDITRINKDPAISFGKRRGFRVKMQAIKFN
jgi:hypothetical protein